MLIGLDLDNTLACYDATFAALAAGEPGLPAAMPRTKRALRDHLRDIGQESRWTELQGHAYGPGMAQARPYAGVVNFIRNARARGDRLIIISQRSRVPFAGEAHDLHASAWQWIREHLQDSNGALFGSDDVCFEASRDSKVTRIAACGCDLFIDDLHEVLEHPNFPRATRRYLFVPPGTDGTARAARTFSDWREFDPWMDP